VTWIVVGASSGLGRALAEELARLGRPLLLVSSDARDLNALASDLGIVHGVGVRTLAHDAADHEGLANRLRAAVEPGERIDGILFPLGLVTDDDDCLLPPARAEEIARVNFLAVVSVVSALLPGLLAQRSGTLVGFGSVAGVRGRSRNVIYAAAKRGLECYFESLRHRCERHGLRVCYYTLGYLDTNLAWGRRVPLPKADPTRAAERICRDLGRKAGHRYYPRAWAPVAWAVRALPWFVFKRWEF
jgi:short-subunit dehydrogenase